MKNIYRDDRHETLVKRLAEQPHPLLNGSLFPTIRELLCFAAVVGYAEGEKKALGKKTSEIPGRVFENSDTAQDIIFLLALADNKNPDILRNENESEAVSIFESYANGGLDVISRWIGEVPSDPYGDQAIIAAMQKYGFFDVSDEEKSGPVEIDI
jgi:dnd system-associated protein 4